MSIIIRQAKVIDASSKYHGKKVDIRIDRGKIVVIATRINETSKHEVTGESLHVSPGWIDLHANFCDPGFEFKETLETGAAAARNGGFSAVVVSSDTHPVADTKAQIDYIIKSGSRLPVEILPAGALSVGLKGEHFTEMYDMHLSGAVAFSDAHHPIENPDLVRRALLYSKTFGGKVMVFPLEKRMAFKGSINEGPMSTSLGLKGIPALSEEVMIARDLAIAEYCDAPIHFTTISTAGAVKLIKRAKKQGIQVTCDVAISNLVWTDKKLETFDSNYKLLPVLRTEKDRKALIKGLNEGTIDFVVTNHQPQNIEEKDCEFEHAGFGQSAIETAYSLYQTHLSDQIPIEKWVEAVSDNPRSYLDLSLPAIAQGIPANLTLFDAAQKWTVTADGLASKGKNTPLVGQEMLGKVVDVIC